MYNLESLQYVISAFFRDAVYHDQCGGDEAEALLDGIDYRNLQQALRHNSRTVYRYTTQGQYQHSFNYRGADLFGQKATRLYEDFDRSCEEAAVTNRNYELWLLEDLSIVATVCVSVSIDDGEYVTEYREIKDDLWSIGMHLDMEELMDNLDELCAAVEEDEQPVYEL